MAGSPARTPLDALAPDWLAISGLLDEALALPPPARADWLACLPAEHARLKDTLSQLLAARDGFETGDFLDALPRLPDGALPGPSGAVGGAPRTGDTVGPYRLLRELGEGGMGSVWLAERADGQLKRQVALKLPRLSWVRGLAERMARERDILATLEHPHIARLYDAGVDAFGRPWLALEFVQGQPIDAHARSQRLDVKQRLALLLQVCEAVAYAHSRLVIHRDLKPANILVTASGQIKLLDFGIAKLMQSDSAVASALTEMAGRALTPDYASPEQVRGEALSTASDVYSLGVLAFELLSGSRPYQLRRGSAAELEDAIENAVLPAASAVAHDPVVRKALRGDLDAILGQALQRHSADRYPTVDALRQDLLRHLAGEAVRARPEGLGRRLDRWTRRHRVPLLGVGAIAAAFGLAFGAGATALVLAVTLAGAGLAVWQARVARRGRLVAERAARRAEVVSDCLTEVLQVGASALPGGRGADQVTLLEALNTSIERIEARLRNHPEDHVLALETMASVYEQLDRPDTNLALLDRAIALQCQFDPRDPMRVQLLERRLSAAFYHQRFEGLEHWLEALDRALDDMGDTGSVHRANALYLWARAQLVRGTAAVDDDEVVARLQRALRLYASTDPAALMRRHALALAVKAFVAADRLADAEEAASEQVLLARVDNAEPGAWADALSVRGLLRLNLGHARAARDDLGEAARAYHDRFGAAHFLALQNDALLAQAMVTCGDGAEIEAGLDLARRALAGMAAIRPGQLKHAQVMERLGVGGAAPRRRRAHAGSGLHAVRRSARCRVDDSRRCPAGTGTGPCGARPRRRPWPR
jgi:serine/threonine-protein kinase